MFVELRGNKRVTACSHRAYLLCCGFFFKDIFQRLGSKSERSKTFFLFFSFSSGEYLFKNTCLRRGLFGGLAAREVQSFK